MQNAIITIENKGAITSEYVYSFEYTLITSSLLIQ